MFGHWYKNNYLDDSIYFIQTGNSKIVVSTNFGQEVGNPGIVSGAENKDSMEKGQNSSKYKYFIKSSEKFQKRQEVIVRKIEVSEVDFIVLGSKHCDKIDR